MSDLSAFKLVDHDDVLDGPVLKAGSESNNFLRLVVVVFFVQNGSEGCELHEEVSNNFYIL